MKNWNDELEDKLDILIIFNESLYGLIGNNKSFNKMNEMWERLWWGVRVIIKN